MHNQSPQQLIPTAEVCAELGITPSTLSRKVKRGLITPAVKGAGIRGPMWFTRAEVDRIKAAA